MQGREASCCYGNRVFGEKQVWALIPVLAIIAQFSETRFDNWPTILARGYKDHGFCFI